MARFSKNSVVQVLETYISRNSSEKDRELVLINSGMIAAAKSLLTEVLETKRFSRAVFAELLQARIDQIQEEHGFDPCNGFAQVRDRRGNEQMWKDYGRYYTLARIAEDTGTPVEESGHGFRPAYVSPRVQIYRKANY